MSETTVERTRRSLHVVAEQVMAGPQYRESGTIRLIVTPLGFRTKSSPSLAVEGTDLVVGTSGDRVALAATTLAAIAAAAGVEPGPAGIYHDETGAGPDEPIDVDAAAAGTMFAALTKGTEALNLFAPDEEPVLWPEHFDVSVLVDDVSYGVSPGDSFIGEPYAYVSATVPDDDPYWNQSFGAARTVSELESVDGIRDFFTEGHRRLHAG